MKLHSVCIHGHFYQPPRENPWTGKVERQLSASPFHDWNDRITHECYGPNGSAKIHDAEDRIRRINNYSLMSFNFGPTLLSWLQDHSAEVYRRILDADRESIKTFGSGSAMAQAFNHMIMPLANEKDKITQVRWGMRDFEFRFGRRPEGMWLPECGVDLATLKVLADEGISFTILAPNQAKRAREIGKEWQEGGINPRRPYRVEVGEGKSVSVFFYDGPMSQGVAFEGGLNDGDRFANRLTSSFVTDTEERQLAHIATDGESYGHHHRFGEMALAHALDRLENSTDISLTNYAAFLAQTPPAWEAEVNAPSSWSCAHGVERWRDHCGCTDGGVSGSNQHWRKPLRSALDKLRLKVDRLFETKGADYLRSPWDARNDYVRVLLDPSSDSAERFLHDRMAGDASEFF
jgi:alpha-amylase/alpha-mannosidase (GH57 family)